MKPKYKFLRVVLGAVVGGALWAGCTTERQVAYEPAGASYHRAPKPVLDRHVGTLNWGVDTHPEWRTGWNMAFPHPQYDSVDAAEVPAVVDEPTLSAPESR